MTVSDEDQSRRKQRRKKHKPFAIECKWDSEAFKSDWSVWKRYENRDDMEKAFAVLQKKKGDWISYRIQDDN